MAIQARKNFKNVIKDIRDVYEEEYYFYVYDTNIEIDTFNKIEAYNFENIRELYVLKSTVQGNLFNLQEIK